MKREEAMKLVENGIAALNDALRAGHSETLERFLESLARFHNYSFNNALLIALQRPDATRVVVTEYDIPLAGARTERAWNDGSDWSLGWPTASLGARWVHDVLADDAGNAWGTRDRGPADVTLFKSLGVAIEDVAAARHIYEKGVAMGTGIWVSLGGLRDDA